MTKVLLKARPTPSQLSDRLAPPVPEGIELYLDRRDLAAGDWLATIRAVVEASEAPRDFVWIVEAPIRTLGGALFDLTSDDEDHRETIRRVLEVGSAIGAVAANVHLVAPTRDLAGLTEAHRRSKLLATRPLLDFYADGCHARGLLAQVENLPPVGRMRESAFVFSPIGLTSADTLELVEARPDVRSTLDLSHAALYLNWKNAPRSAVADDLEPVARFCRDLPGPEDLRSYADVVAGVSTTVHVSNAAGLLGEGLPYRQGDEDLDRVLGALLGKASYLVTETLESDPDQAIEMRGAQRQLLELRRTRAGQ
ncbi:MAG: hypothetical protein ACRDIY_13075 [Chloroflexota bacterium]